MRCIGKRDEKDTKVSWIYLIVAGLLEIGWPVGLKMSQEAETRILAILLAIGFMAASGFCLWMAQKQIPIGTAYAVWTGIGAAGTFLNKPSMRRRSPLVQTASGL